MRMAARTAVVAGTATAVSGRVAHKQDEKYADQAAQQQAAAAPAAPADDDPTEKIKQLADLHAQGILSDEEFAAAKKKALGI
jgi:membrane protease subunit (stomatin/prohibitin family)